MIPKEIFNRRRNHSTPETFILTLINYCVVGIDIAVFISNGHVKWFFWVVLAFLAWYNYYHIRRNREDYTKPAIIAYIVSLAGLPLLFLLIH
jgi:hypothetical protein